MATLVRSFRCYFSIGGFAVLQRHWMMSGLTLGALKVARPFQGKAG
ncbi:MAG: hypothetical protein AB1609_17680 [Bacillota bacterium]